jgi:hypothetical protein
LFEQCDEARDAYEGEIALAGPLDEISDQLFDHEPVLQRVKMRRRTGRDQRLQPAHKGGAEILEIGGLLEFASPSPLPSSAVCPLRGGRPFAAHPELGGFERKTPVRRRPASENGTAPGGGRDRA